MPVTQGQGNPDWTREETILALEVLRGSARLPSKSSDEVANLSELLRGAPLHPRESRNPRFRNVDGVYLKLQNLAAVDRTKNRGKGLTFSRMDRLIWTEFGRDLVRLHDTAQLIREAFQAVTAERLLLPEADDVREFAEGGLLLRVHMARERARGLRSRLLSTRRNSGGIVCDACGSLPRIASPPSVQEAEFEVHHRLPLADSVSRKTRLRDLALLCARCHRLIHAIGRIRSRFVSVEDLRDELAPSMETAADSPRLADVLDAS
jgi:5-methylcytosine-specific restriction enzyme A